MTTKRLVLSLILALTLQPRVRAIPFPTQLQRLKAQISQTEERGVLGIYFDENMKVVWVDKRSDAYGNVLPGDELMFVDKNIATPDTIRSLGTSFVNTVAVLTLMRDGYIETVKVKRLPLTQMSSKFQDTYWYFRP